MGPEDGRAVTTTGVAVRLNASAHRRRNPVLSLPYDHHVYSKEIADPSNRKYLFSTRGSPPSN